MIREQTTFCCFCLVDKNDSVNKSYTDSQNHGDEVARDALCSIEVVIEISNVAY